MSTTVKNHKKQRGTKTVEIAEVSQGAYKLIPSDKIIINKNYRGIIDKKDLQEFASDLKIHGIISPVTVRPNSAGYFELVAGERRVRAAAIAGIFQIPAIVKDLTNEEVLEIQLSENLNRENPHPLKEAFAILQMQQSGKSFNDIYKRLTKSKSFVYQRLKLSQLDAGFHGVFLANKINITTALKLADLSSQSQQFIYEEHFEAWNDDDFEVPDYLETVIKNLRFDLHEANFSIRSKSLVPEAGACINCRYNSALAASLFPELAKEAVCSNAACFEQKTLAHYRNLFTKALEKENPEALITNNGTTETLSQLLETYEPAQSLPVYNYYDVGVIDEPNPPTPEDYEEEMGKNGGTQFDKAGFDQAVAEYNDELQQLETAKKQANLKKGFI